MRVQSKTEHEELYQALCAAMRPFEKTMPAIELLGVASNFVGKLMAVQDQTRFTPQRVYEVVALNIELGNQQAVAALLDTKGNA